MKLYDTYIALTEDSIETIKKLGHVYNIHVSKIFTRSGVSSRICRVKEGKHVKYIYNLSPAQENILNTLLTKTLATSLGVSDVAVVGIIKSYTNTMFKLNEFLSDELIQEQIKDVKHNNVLKI